MTLRSTGEFPTPHIGEPDRKVVATVGEEQPPMTRFTGLSAYILEAISEHPIFADTFGIPREEIL